MRIFSSQIVHSKEKEGDFLCNLKKGLNRLYFILIICSLIISIHFGKGLIVFSQSEDVQEDFGLMVGQLAPDFTLETLDGKKLRLMDLRGKKVLLNFWASWCAPCKEEMPVMQNVYEKHKDQNIEIVAVNLTFGREKISQVEKFVNNYELTFPIPLDIEAEVQDKYQIYPIPTSYFINEKGFIHSKYFGPMDEEYIINEFEKM